MMAADQGRRQGKMVGGTRSAGSLRPVSRPRPYGWNLSGGRGPRSSQALAQANATPPVDPKFIEKFFNRTIDLITKYQPDLLYFDDTIMPIWPSSDIGPRIAAYLYNTNMARNGGQARSRDDRQGT